MGNEDVMNYFDEDLMEDIKQRTPRVRPKGFGITALEYSVEKEIHYNTAVTTLEKMAVKKILKCEKMYYKGRIARVYFK